MPVTKEDWVAPFLGKRPSDGPVLPVELVLAQLHQLNLAPLPKGGCSD